MDNPIAVVLAAGKGTRMKSDLPKVLCEANGRPLVGYVIDALRDGTALADSKLEALRIFAAKVNVTRGDYLQADLDAFLSAGYTKENLLEVIVGTSLKVLSNYTNHIASTPVDDAFQANAWSKAA